MKHVVKVSAVETSLITEWSDGDRVLVFCDATDAPFTLRLPDAKTTFNVEFKLIKTDNTSNKVTVVPGISGQKINGEDSQELKNQYDAPALESDNLNWFAM